MLNNVKDRILACFKYNKFKTISKKIAASGQGSISKQVVNENNSVTMQCPSATQVDPPLSNCDGFLTDSIECGIQEDNDAFVRVFTSQDE